MYGKLIFFILSTATVLVFGWRTLRGDRGGSNSACISTTLHSEEAAGIHFAVVDTSCDTLAKDENVRVFAWTKDESNKTTLFRFDPINGEEIPTILVNKKGQIVVSIERVGSVIEKASQFEGHMVTFEIGKDITAELRGKAYFSLHQAAGLYEQFVANKCPSGKKRAQKLLLYYMSGSNGDVDKKRDQLWKWTINEKDPSIIDLETFRLSIHELQQQLDLQHESVWHDQIVAECKSMVQ